MVRRLFEGGTYSKLDLFGEALLTHAYIIFNQKKISKRPKYHLRSYFELGDGISDKKNGQILVQNKRF